MSAPRSTQSATGGAAAGNATHATAAPASSAATTAAPASAAADAVVPGAPGVPLPPVSGAARFINPYSDFGFKRIFGQEATKGVLIAFLNAVLPAEFQIKTLRFRNPEQKAPSANVKGVFFDLYCTGGDGTHFIVEMQQEKQKDLEERALVYVARAISNQLPPSTGGYKKLKAVVYVSVMAFKSGLKGLLPRAWQGVTLKNDADVPFSNKMRFFFIQTPYFKKRESELATPLDKWLFFLRNLNALSDIPPPLRAEKPFQTAFATAEFARMTPAEQVAYLTDIDAENSFASALEAKWDDGVEQGRAEGATAAKLETARKMKADGLPPDVIARYTGLSPDALEGV